MSTANSHRNQHLVVGTAGHIDHGKSRLVMALTGVDPDRLAEEKVRGMTIDLGFAALASDAGTVYFVDVPGHERFIRNMVAGASGVDVALLVVAADDSVMPQTREHAELLSLLGVSSCVVALNKMDLVDDEWGDAVEEEVRELLDRLAIEVRAVVRTSAESGRGIEQLRDVLTGLLVRDDDAAARPIWFRMPIDRAFTIAGRGTVVTGSVLHGGVAPNDEVELWPGGRLIRLRDLQTHYDHADRAAGRMRLGINLAGVGLDEVGRGCELATPGYLEPGRFLDCWLPWLTMPGKQLKQTLRLRLHLATRELLVEMRLTTTPADLRVSGVCAQLKVAEPVVAEWGQRFILRDEAGTRTLGGGVVLRPVATPWTGKRPADAAALETLRTGAPLDRLAEVIRAGEWMPARPCALVTRAGLRDERELQALLGTLRGRRAVQAVSTPTGEAYLHRDHLATLKQDVVRRLEQWLENHPRAAGVPRGEWPGWMPRACPERLRPALVDWLFAQEAVELDNDVVKPAGRKDELSKADRALLEQILAAYRDGAFQPPTPAGVAERTAQQPKRVRELIELAVTRRELIRINADILLHAEHWRNLVRTLAELIESGGGAKVSVIRERLGTTRKYIVPIMEKLDSLGVTKRLGDERVLGPNAASLLGETGNR